MDLIKCPACSGDVSPAAPKCPRCGHPLKKTSKKVRLLVGCGVLVVVSVLLYQYVLSARTKQAINLVASSSGLTVTPWPDRAEAAVRAICQAEGFKIANAVVGATHPTGENPSLSTTSFAREGEVLVCSFHVAWSGGLIGTPYVTVVSWRISEQGHIGASLVSDSAQIGASPAAPAVLDAYFREKVWPAVAKSAGS